MFEAIGEKSGKKNGELGTQVDPNTTELTVPEELYLERKVKFVPRIVEFYRMYMAKLGKVVPFNDFVNQAIDEYFTDVLGMNS